MVSQPTHWEYQVSPYNPMLGPQPTLSTMRPEQTEVLAAQVTSCCEFGL